MIPRQSADDVVFNAIEHAARVGRRCPTNSELASMMGARSPAAPVAVLARLARAGRIRVISGNNTRVVDIPEMGIGTAGLMPQQHWRERRGQTLVTHLGQPDAIEAIELPIARQDVARVKAEVPQAVSRDPCPRCGARGDFPCGHAPVSGGRLLAL